MLRTILLCGAAAAAFVATACAPGAWGQSGGVGGGASTAGTADPTFYDVPFGTRDLRRGMNGTDVQTLNWTLQGLEMGAPPHTTFDATTDGWVRHFQSSAGLAANGVVNQYTRKSIASRMRNQKASWYGPGFWGRRTACGEKLRKSTVGVAHRRLPCGTRVVFAYRGRWVRATVIDRGPYTKGRKWDLTRALAWQLGTARKGTAKVKVAAAR